MIKSTLLAAALAVGMVSSASAATVNVFEGPVHGFNYATAAAFAAANYTPGPYTITTFESFESNVAYTTPGTGDTNPNTAVGSFVATPPSGNGTSAVAPLDKAIVKSAVATGGRKPVDGKNFLDSNDNNGVTWTASIAGRAITSIAFFLTDANDTGREVTLKVGDSAAVSILPPGLINSNLAFITIFLNAPAEVVEIAFSKSQNDGFGIDSIQVSSVPLPPTALLLGSAFVGAAFLRRRKAARV
jgi:hypothetical protein